MLVLRVLFALLFIATSLGKLLDNRGFADVLSTYHLFPSGILLPLALFISLGELGLGISLLRARNLQRDSVLVILINSSYLFLAAVTLFRGISLSNCGCFGVFWARPLSLWTLVEDAVLVVLSIALKVSAKRTL